MKRPTDWDELVQKLFSRATRKSRDLTDVLALDEKLGRPHTSFRSVHVAGTNGKGSVTWKIAKALEREGYTVGLYTSPHITDVRERIQINGEMIPKEEALSIFESLLDLPLGFSFFDLMTAAAFLYFKKKRVDWAVIEVGLGGRFDATNVISPEMTVITSIGWDHMHLLGHSLEEIAWEKGGIVKPGIPLVTGPSATRFFPKSIAVPPVPFFDLENQAVARAALQEMSISENSIAFGLQTRPPCRFERRGNVILDVAHNPDGFRKLVEALQIYFPQIKKFHFILGFSKDKDWRKCLDLIAPIAGSIAAVQIKKERLECPKVLQEYDRSITIFPTVQSAIKPDEINVVAGSFYLMNDLTAPK